MQSIVNSGSYRGARSQGGTDDRSRRQNRPDDPRRTETALRQARRRREQRGLLAALRGRLVPHVVTVRGRHHRAGRHRLPRRLRHRRQHRDAARVLLRRGGHRDRGCGDLPDRHPDRRRLRPLRRGHGPAHPRRRVRLFRLHAHLADLRQFHGDLLLARRLDHGAGVPAGLRAAAGSGLSADHADRAAVRAVRHAGTGQAADVDPAGVAGRARTAVRGRAGHPPGALRPVHLLRGHRRCRCRRVADRRRARRRGRPVADRPDR